MDSETILASIRDALRGELAEGYSVISGLVESQGKLLADQAKFIAEQRALGELRENEMLFNHLMEGLEENSRNLARSVAMLTALTVEKAWNAVAKAIWGGLRTILSGAGVPDALLPDVPPHI